MDLLSKKNWICLGASIGLLVFNSSCTSKYVAEKTENKNIDRISDVSRSYVQQYDLDMAFDEVNEGNLSYAIGAYSEFTKPPYSEIEKAEAYAGIAYFNLVAIGTRDNAKVNLKNSFDHLKDSNINSSLSDLIKREIEHPTDKGVLDLLRNFDSIRDDAQ